MRRIKPSELAGSGVPEAEQRTVTPRTRSGWVWKGFAAFLLGLTLGVSAIIFGQNALTDAAQDRPSLWDTPPALRR